MESIHDNGPRPDTNSTTTQATPSAAETNTKFCVHCGEKIAIDAVICIKCGRQVEELRRAANTEQPNVVINNTNTNSNVNSSTEAFIRGRQRSKWVALLLCFFVGYLGVHKFYEGKVGLGILYLFTLGLFGIGVFVDFIVLLFKPNPYFV